MLTPRGKVQVAMATPQSISQLRYVPGEAGCSHEDSVSITGIADDVLAKGDDTISLDMAVLSLFKEPEATS